jgi:DNA-binding transcriptional LysR family regulator
MGRLATSYAIELRHLRYFLAVYEELHFGRAAEKIHIAPPPLSQAIRKLEAEIGIKLFERTSRKVEPTKAAHVFAAEARKVLASFEFAVGETQRTAEPEQTLRVGCAIHIPDSRIHRFLSVLRQQNPTLQVGVTHLLGVEQVARLRAGELDLGVFTHAEDYVELEWERLLPGDRLSAFLPSTHRLAGNSTLTPEDTTSETLLCSARSVNPPFWDTLMRSLEGAGHRFARREECSTDPRDVFLAVASGAGIALAPQSFLEMADFVSPELVAIPLDPPVSYPDTIAAWRANPPRLVAELLPSIRGAAAELYARLQEPMPEPRPV